jgi:diguanylate cyclase (GGDEF)-like protein
MALVFAAVGAGIAAAVWLMVLHRRVRRLAQLTIVDPLTGAHNRRHLDTCLAAAIERRCRTGEPASLLLFDVDQFKTVNDRFGHAAGDRVLREIASLAARRLRQIDALFRIGGDEFGVLLSNANLSTALRVAEDLRALAASAEFVDARRVSISMGVSELADRQAAGSWMSLADAALYRAKRLGGNRVASIAVKARVRADSRLVTAGTSSRSMKPPIVFPRLERAGDSTASRVRAARFPRAADRPDREADRGHALPRR